MNVERRILRQDTVELIIADRIAQRGGVVGGKYGLADVVADEQVSVGGKRVSEDQNADLIAVVRKREPYLLCLCDGGNSKDLLSR